MLQVPRRPAVSRLYVEIDMDRNAYSVHVDEWAAALFAFKQLQESLMGRLASHTEVWRRQTSDYNEGFHCHVISFTTSL